MKERKQSVTWSPEAIADLDAIWDYYAKVAGAQTAEKMVRLIHEVCTVVGEHTLIGRPRYEVLPTIHSFVVPPYVVFYHIREGDIPEIVRVLDERQDIDSTFSDSDHKT